MIYCIDKKLDFGGFVNTALIFVNNYMKFTISKLNIP